MHKVMCLCIYIHVRHYECNAQSVIIDTLEKMFGLVTISNDYSQTYRKRLYTPFYLHVCILCSIDKLIDVKKNLN
jgi:hypothetical protein